MKTTRDRVRVEEHFDGASGGYDRKYTQPETIQDCEKTWRHADALRALQSNQAASVIEVGCGTGVLANSIARSIPGEYLGMDISQGMLDTAAAQRLPACTFVKADFQEYEPTRSWDAFVSLGCLEYIGALDQCLGPILHRYTPRVMVVSLPNSRCVWRRIRTALVASENAGVFPARLGNVRRVADKAGYETETIGRYVWCPIWAVKYLPVRLQLVVDKVFSYVFRPLGPYTFLLLLKKRSIS